MPPKKKQISTSYSETRFLIMEAKVVELENDLLEVKSSLNDVQSTKKWNQDYLVSMLKKCIGKSIDLEDESVNKEGSPQKKTLEFKYNINKLHCEALTEFRQSAKKVELLVSDGEDPTDWISLMEVYFRVQETIKEVKVSLVQLCMEGPTIHFFNSLLDEEEPLTWDKCALLERYGGHGDGDVY